MSGSIIFDPIYARFMETDIKKVQLVINPVSGDTDKGEIVDKVSELVGPWVELAIYRTAGKDDIGKLQKEIKSFRPDRILVAGGDGTIRMAAQACYGTEIVLAIIPAGSANGLATDLGIPDNLEGALAASIGSSTITIDALRIGDSIGLHISDLGLNAELIENYSEGSVRGRFGYFLSSIPTLLGTEGPYRFTISANGQERKVDAIMVAFANSRKFGTGALVNPYGEIDDGRFEVLIFKKLDIVGTLRTLNGNMDMAADFVDVNGLRRSG